jgi:hypothetical protein
MKTALDVLLEKFEEDVSSSTEYLSAGGAKSFDEYREVVGRIRGLRLAIQTTKDLAKNLMDSDDD